MQANLIIFQYQPDSQEQIVKSNSAVYILGRYLERYMGYALFVIHPKLREKGGMASASGCTTALTRLYFHNFP